jgi:hypothetical protein
MIRRPAKSVELICLQGWERGRDSESHVDGREVQVKDGKSAQIWLL